MKLADLPRQFARTARRCLVRCLAAGTPDFEVTAAPALIVAPHPDDEVFGAAGLIMAKRNAGAQVHILFLTGGGAAHSNCCGLPAADVIRERRLLALNAATLLGLDERHCTFLDLPDGTLPARHAAEFGAVVDSVRAVILESAPAEVYVTHPGEVWQDHIAAAEIAAEACRTCPTHVALWFYLVWAPLNQSALGLLRFGWRTAARVSLVPCFSRKQQAVAIYLTTGPRTACGRPWVGDLPTDFLRIFEWPYEVFFRAA